MWSDKGSDQDVKPFNVFSTLYLLQKPPPSIAQLNDRLSPNHVFGAFLRNAAFHQAQKLNKEKQRIEILEENCKESMKVLQELKIRVVKEEEQNELIEKALDFFKTKYEKSALNEKILNAARNEIADECSELLSKLEERQKRVQQKEKRIALIDDRVVEMLESIKTKKLDFVEQMYENEQCMEEIEELDTIVSKKYNNKVRNMNSLQEATKRQTDKLILAMKRHTTASEKQSKLLKEIEELKQIANALNEKRPDQPPGEGKVVKSKRQIPWILTFITQMYNSTRRLLSDCWSLHSLPANIPPIENISSSDCSANSGLAHLHRKIQN